MKEVSCRTAKPSDINEIMELEDACFNTWTREPESTYLERIECFPQGFMVIAYEDGLIGAITSEIRFRDSASSTSEYALGHSL